MITRRNTLKGITASAVAMAGHRSANGQSAKKITVDAVVVGAGLAGLAAAGVFRRAGRSVAIVEANNRVGGRAWTSKDELGNPWERGAQAINSDMTLMTSLVAEFGGKLVDMRMSGRLVGLHSDIDAKAMAAVVKEAEKVMDHFYDHSALVPQAQGASLSSVIDSFKLSPLAKLLVRSVLTELFGKLPEAVPYSAVLSARDGYASKQDDWIFKVDVGIGEIARRESQIYSDNLFLRKPVRSVAQSEKGVTVLADDLDINAKVAVLAIPPTSARYIDFAGGLTPDMLSALNSYEGGNFIKAQVSYPSAFWRKSKLSGTIIDVQEPGFVTTNAGGRNEGALAIYIGGPKAVELAAMDAEARRANILGRISKGLGSMTNQQVRYLETMWMPSPFTPGGYNAIVKIGGRDNAAQLLATPVNRLVFASSEISPMFAGYTEGARRSGSIAGETMLRVIDSPSI